MSKQAKIIDEISWAADASNKIAEAVWRISDAVDELLNAGLTEDALVALIRSRVVMPKDDIRAVLRGLSEIHLCLQQESKTDDHA